jgi:hypothetical protein
MDVATYDPTWRVVLKALRAWLSARHRQRHSRGLASLTRALTTLR